MAFDKPYEWTSFGLVAKVRYLLCKRLGVKKLKVGHAGTLDPLATGGNETDRGTSGSYERVCGDAPSGGYHAFVRLREACGRGVSHGTYHP